MGISHYWNLLTKKKVRNEYKNPAKLSFSNIKGVFQSLWRKTQTLAGFNLPIHIYEQIIWRRTQVMEKSPECWSKGKCINCGCEVLGKTMEDRPCEGNCYPEMMKFEIWEGYKRELGVKIFD